MLLMEWFNTMRHNIIYSISGYIEYMYCVCIQNTLIEHVNWTCQLNMCIEYIHYMHLLKMSIEHANCMFTLNEYITHIQYIVLPAYPNIPPHTHPSCSSSSSPEGHPDYWHRGPNTLSLYIHTQTERRVSCRIRERLCILKLIEE